MFSPRNVGSVADWGTSNVARAGVETVELITPVDTSLVLRTSLSGLRGDGARTRPGARKSPLEGNTGLVGELIPWLVDGRSWKLGEAGDRGFGEEIVSLLPRRYSANASRTVWNLRAFCFFNC